MNRIILALIALLVIGAALAIVFLFSGVPAPAPVVLPPTTVEYGADDPEPRPDDPRKVTQRTRTEGDAAEADDVSALLSIAGAVQGPDGAPLAGVTISAARVPELGSLPAWERKARETIPANTELEDALDLFRASLDLGPMSGMLDQFRDEEDGDVDGDIDMERVLQRGNDALSGMDSGDVREAMRSAGGPEEVLRSFNRLMTAGPTPHTPVGSATTDGEGTFRIEGLDPGTYRLRAEATGHARVYARTDAGDEDVNLVLPAGVRFGGTLVSTDGRAVVGAQLNFRGETIHVAEDGRFSIDGGRVPREPLYITAPGYVPIVAALKLTGHARDEDVKITLQPAGSVHGQVLALGGGPVEGADVMTAGNLLTQIGMAAWTQRGAAVVIISVPALATTGPEGRYVLDSVAAGNVVVSARFPSYLPGRSERRPLDQGQAISGVDVILTKEALLTGTVTDGQGSPIGGAEVSVAVPNDIQGIAGMAAQFFGSAKESGTTDASGVYRVKGIPGGEREVTVAATGYLSQVLPLSVADGGETKRDFTLEPGLRVAGFVYDPDGEPVDGADVTVSWPDPTASRNPLAAMMGISGPKGPVTKTAEDGSFNATGLQAGPYVVRASHEGFVDVSEVDVAAGRENIELVLVAAAGLRGVVLSAATGEPVPRAQVMRKGGPRERGANPFMAMLDMGKRIRADENGRFQIPGLAAGSYELWARGKGFADSKHERIKLTEGESVEDIEFVLPEGATLSGRVTRLDGSGPVDSALVYVSRSTNQMMSMMAEQMSGATDGSAAPPNTISVRTDEHGYFTLTGLTPGSLTVEVRGADFANASKRGVAVPGPELEMQVGLGGTVEGVVLDDGDRPVVGSTVMLQTGMGMGQRTTSTDARGYYRHERIPPGSYMVISMNLAAQDSPLAGMNMKTVQVREGGTTVQDFREVSTGSPVEGTVMKDGKPLAEATVLAMGGPSGMRMTQTDEAGNFTLKGLDPGEYTVMVQVDFMGGGNSSRKVTVAEGEVVEALRFELSSLKVEGVVIDAESGQPISAAHVVVMSSTRGAVTSMTEAVSRQQGQAFTDGDGKFAIEGVPEGEFTLRIASAGYAAQFQENVRGGTGSMKIEMSRGTAVRILVTDSAGTPLAGASVNAEDSEGREGVAFDPTMQGVTDGEGVAELRLAPGRYTVHAQASGHPSTSATVDTASSQEVRIRLPDGGSVDVRVVDASGAVAAGVGVTLRDSEGKLVSRRLSMSNFLDAQNQTDAGGMTTQRGLPAGEFTVLAVSPDGQRGEGKVTVTVGQTAKITVTIE